MHPALSVIFFTTLSGAGYGLLAWLGLHYAWRPLPLSREFALVPFGIALALATVGLLCSMLHLGRPGRAWRAFGQWRTSWLSREGVLALLTYLPALGLVWLVWRGADGVAMHIEGVLLVLASLATLVCTAMIYASLKTIPAWRHPLVLPAYLAFALLCGWLLLATLLALTGWQPATGLRWGVATLAIGLGALKLVYWREIDRKPLPATRAGATALHGIGEPRTFEAPHTEANYITREMGFVVARRHARALRAAAFTLFALLPAALVLLSAQAPVAALGLAAISALAGAFVERWLFFAEAKHLVTLYY